ncbi:MAG: helix-turn-helix transcriptional regulator [Sedimentisphaerales bacterium]|nr:helix-turn-helix transcriptional regulator [Sedimentisphaerales bacterium]
MSTLEELVEAFKALSDPTRLQLLQLLRGERPLCVNALAKRLGVSQPAVSQHLRVLRQAGLVKGQREGSFIHYSVRQDQLDLYATRIAKMLGKGNS